MKDLNILEILTNILYYPFKNEIYDYQKSKDGKF